MQTTSLKASRLSIQQDRLWSFQQGSSAYYTQCTAMLQGELDTIAFEHALQEVMEDYEILHTLFYAPPGMDIPLQVIDLDSQVHCSLIDLQGIEPLLQDELIEMQIFLQAEEPFDLVHGPLLRTTLLRTEKRKHLFFCCLPALCADAATFPALFADLGRRYAILLAGQQEEIEEPLQYIDISAWQRKLLVSESAKIACDFWEKTDLSVLSQAHFPFEGSFAVENHTQCAAAQAPFEPAVEPVSINELLSRQLLEMARAVPLSTVLLTCWQVVLWRLTGSTDLVMSVGEDGRAYEELSDAVGLLTRFLPVTLHLEEQHTFTQAAVSLDHTLKEPMKWQPYFTWPSQKEEGHLNYLPLAFEYESWPESTAYGPLEISLRHSRSCTEPFDLKLSARWTGTCLQLLIHYNRCCLKADYVKQLASAFQVLLQGVVEQPQLPVVKLPILVDEQREHLLHAFSAPPVQGISASAFHHLFEEQARKFPEHMAVISTHEQWTYQELNRRANQLARVLRRRGVGPNVLVGLCLTRSAQMIAGLLGILKAGGAYVPLDPESPLSRLEYQLRDTQAPILLTQKTLLPEFSHWSGAIVYWETIDEEMVAQEGSNLGFKSEAEDLAYVIYTSGSTGLPKGVMVQQRSVVNYTLALCELLGTVPGWHFATVSTLAADLGNTAIFCALASGGCLQVLDYETITSGEAFARWATRYPIDVLKIVPSHLFALLANEQSRGFLPRQALIMGGEALPPALLELLSDVECTCRVYNHYGPTEATIGVLVNALGSLHGYRKEEGATIPLGRPIPGISAYILDPANREQIMPIGVTGELYIGGAGLAAGYMHQAEQSAERFVPHPFSKEEGARLYRTGDLARYTSGGQIEFVGRNDNQVKLRGYRVELGEIEAVLRQHANVWECVVVLRKDEAADLHIVGYIVPKNRPAPAEEELYTLLRTHLPEHMIPSTIVYLNDLPLTANGKVDRQRLPRPERPKEGSRLVRIAPHSPIEEILLDIWKTLLQVPSLDIYDNFFHLGGHSLLATQVISRVRAALHVEISLTSLFEVPTVEGLARQVEQALRGGEKIELPPLLSVERAVGHPLSFAQQRLWFIDQLEPESSAYLVRNARRLTGRLDTYSLERALNALVQRHESLRTTFELRAGNAVQIIKPPVHFHLPIVDLCGLEGDEFTSVARKLAVQEGDQPCNLARGPLFRTFLLRLEDEVHVLLWTLHHIISDAWSSEVFVRELTALYQAFSTRQPSPLLPLPIQYVDYAVWQRQWMRGEILEKQLAYWKQQLAGSVPLELPADHARPPKKTYRGAYLVRLLPVMLQENLVALSQQEGVTLFMTLLAAFQALLARYTGQYDVSVGSPIANRTRAELEGLIGFFVNTLVLRTDLSGNPSFIELLKRVQTVALGAYAHQDVPFEYLVDMLQPERDLSRSPLFQVMFTLQQITGVTVADTGSGSSEKPLPASLNPEYRTTKFDLTFAVTSSPQGLYCDIEYNTDLFEPATINRLLEHWHILLESVVAQPQVSLSELRLLPDTELQRLLVEWNPAAYEEIGASCLHTLFEQQVERRPDAIALVYEGEFLTYEQLNVRANQLAHMLCRIGVDAEVMVGLSLERSSLLVIGVLGILKAGGAYVPLDPSYPAERLAFILADTQTPILLTQQVLVEKLPVQAVQGVKVVGLDADWAMIACEPKHNLHNQLDVGQIAYVIYTSGSTGKPKGVMINHANVYHLFASTENCYHFNENDVWTLFHSYAFDFSVWEIWGALLSGGQLVVVPYEISRTPESFYELLDAQNVTVLNQTPSAFYQLMQAEASAQGQRHLMLRAIIFGGEALDLQRLQPWFERNGEQGPQLINMYGITETTVHVTYRPLGMQDLLDAPGSVIGVPLPSLQIYILDEYLRPVPIGVPGQIFVSGSGLSRGYLNRPELTAERFVPHPFSSQPGMRLYKTGDLARFLVNGELEYLGRVDQQVKIRGFRIELGEIEDALRLHPELRECVVMTWEDVPGDKRLVAYVVAQKNMSPGSGELRRFLAEKLPDYMLPAVFVPLEELPLTVHGKLDRRALPLPTGVRPELDETFAQPRTATEEVLAGIWSSVLGIEQVGSNDNFFTLGGDSIRSIQVLSQARERGINFSLQQLFQHQTIHKLAQVVDVAQNVLQPLEQTSPFSLISLHDRQRLPISIEDAYPLTALQGGMFFHSQYSPDTAAYHDITSYHVQAPFKCQLLERVIQSLVACHPTMRTAFDLSSFSEPLQLVYRHLELPLQVVDLRECSSTEQEKILAVMLEEDKSQRFDWAHAPLLRFQIHLRSTQSFQFTLSFHHAILDGWSVASLFTELFKTYRTLLGDDAAMLPSPPAIQYRDFVALEQKLIALEEAKRYWIEKLKDSTSVLLPRWVTPGQAPDNAQVYVLPLPISQEVSDSLKKLARKLSVPVKSVLLAAHLRVLSLLYGQRDVLTGVVSNGRPETPDGERVLGLFLNTLPFRMQLSGGRWTDLIRETFAAECELLPYRWYPLANIQRLQGGHELFEVIFNFIHFHVYEGLLGAEQKDTFQVLGRTGFEKTNFTLAANFSLDLVSARVRLSLRCNTNELDLAQIKAIGSYYVNTLVALANESDGYYELQSPLSLIERQQVLSDWNATRIDYSREKCIHELFAEQVERTPDAVALVFANEQLTYADLFRRARQLAYHLSDLGVGPEVLVGLYMERSLEMLVGLLGILIAGGAYVPLDPAYPPERLTFMLEDSQVAVLVTQPWLVDGLPPHDAQIVCLSAQAWEPLEEDHETRNFMGNALSDNLAYVIYTSGSTGRPKGTAITHRAVNNFFNSMQRVPGMIAQDVMLAVTSLSFDIAVLELLLPVTVGARVHIVSREVAADGPELVTYLATSNATIMQATPTTWRMLCNENWTGNEQIKMLCGGEVLPLELARQLRPRGMSLRNMYGPTETTIWSATGEVSGDEEQISIGRAIDNTQIYLLDDHFMLVPIGVPGKLYIGGDGLARGYLHRPELNAEKFIPDPFGEQAGARMYYTGDLARWLPDGTLECLGRDDRQVKVRGFRIELGEVETILGHYPTLKECVVVARDDASGEKQLVAYLVAGSKPGPSTSELRSYLQEKLPHYMVPSHFVILDALPLTPNGKIDRHALPLADMQADVKRTVVIARTPIEEALTEIWMGVLRRSPVSIHDNFFELGGHSLLATQLISRVRTVLRVELPLRNLFEAPTIASMAVHVELMMHDGQKTEVPPLVPTVYTTPLPLSFAQQRLWLLNQLDPDSSAYLMQSMRRLRGQLESGALERSLEELVRRHASLRTIFQVQAEQPAQIVLPADRFILPIVDLSEMIPEQRMSLVQQLARQEMERPYDLGKEPPFHIWLLRTGETDHVLLITMHHIISDAWSMQVFYRELLLLYQAFLAGQPVPLPPLPIQYFDYALWQRQWLQGRVLEEKMRYWRQQLAGASPLELPTDHPRPPVQTFNGAHQGILLPAHLHDSLVALSHQEGVTLFMLLLASFQVLLARYANQDDISLGIPIANRTHGELEDLIGVFVNTLVLRTDLSGDPSFVEVLRRVREVALGAYTHQDVPFEQLVEALKPERSLSRSPLFQVLFNAQLSMEIVDRVPVEDGEKIAVNRLDFEHTTSPFDLTFSIVSSGPGLDCTIEYNTDLFEAGTIRRMLQHWQVLLEGIVSNPHALLASLLLLTAAERQLILGTWNDTEVEVPVDYCIHQLFEKQAEHAPEAIAGMFEDEQVTYAALNRRANQFAHYLRAQGVGPEIPVGICLPRSLELLVALLGVLKAGGAYIPLEPFSPTERIAFVLQDAQIAILLTQTHMLDRLAATCTARMICLDADWAAAYDMNPAIAISPANLAYVIYTSGSTGSPKGVLVPHQAIVNHCMAVAAYYNILPQDRVLQFASLSFDVAAEEIFPTLARGATLVLSSNAVLTSLASFQRLIEQAELTVLNLPAPFWHTWVAELCATQTTCPASVRLLIAGSEKVLAERFAMWQQCVSGPVRWCNAYGLTETTVTTTIYEADNPPVMPSMPVGRPVANTQVYVLDRCWQPVPVGIVGEFYIGGAGVARGYLSRPELTAERFLPDPFSAIPGARVYSTGDRVRYLSDGNLDFVGRSDEQIKIRGYRIEPEEIETVLNAYPVVRESVVLVREDAAGDRYLAGYFVTEEHQETPSVSTLRQYLQGRLPDYMVPAYLIALDALPLTANGKVDRQALQRQEGWQNEPGEVEIALRTPIEELLEEIWCEVLRRSHIGIHENFFELGGHSLLAMQLSSRLQTILQVEISLKSLFEFPTIAALGSQVEKLLQWKGKSHLPPLRPVSRDADLPLSFAQQRLWFQERLIPGNTAYLMPSVQHTRGELNEAVLESSLRELVQRQESLRTTFHVRAGEPYQIIHPVENVWLPVVDLQGLEREERVRVAQQLEAQEAMQPCDLAYGSLLRVRLLRLEEQRHVLLLTVHHIISDGWSYEIMLHELTTIYQALMARQSSPLLPLPIQYADYAVWQRQWLKGEVLESLLDYWMQQLGGAPVLKLPVDHPALAGSHDRSGLYAFRLSAELSQALIALSRREGVTLFMTMLAAYQVLLYRYSGQVDIVLGTDSANRNHVELEKLIGFFVNLLVLRTDLSGKPTFREVLRRVREVVLGAYMHQDAPFELLVQKLAPTHRVGEMPLIQGLFVMQTLPSLGEGLNDVVRPETSAQRTVSQDPEVSAGVQRFHKENVTTAKFDLALFMQERGGRLEGTFNYRQDLFEASTIAAMIERFGVLLQSITEQPGASIDLLAFFTENELMQQKQKEQLLLNRARVQSEEWFDL